MTATPTGNTGAGGSMDRGALTRDMFDALSATGAALGAVEFISRETFSPLQVARLAIVERHLSAALVALDALATGLGIHLTPGKPDGKGTRP